MEERITGLPRDVHLHVQSTWRSASRGYPVMYTVFFTVFYVANYVRSRTVP